MQAINTLRRQAGDTIVEVMVVLAILGLAIGISYGTANRSLLDARQAQENSQATERLQAQIENLRVMASNPATLALGLPNPDYIFQPPAQHFCTYVDATGIHHVQLITIANPLPTLCHYDNLYDVNVKFQSLSPAGGTFTLVATWPDVQGQGNDTVTLSYRYYKL